ncbi:hypothetical protein [Burkholderia gladioli]|uniref:hypothetical protein n=1 Tax=Burkholderia gladioli TaxID=28095 RepID=UPI001640C03C|nr:hypothetical protein [Burkholderia gladioli]
MNHLEALAKEWLDWTGHIVRANVRVGKRLAGGHDMEVDVVGYSPNDGIIRHYELSLDAHTWEKRELRFEKKFRLARLYMFSELFPFLSESTPIEQYAVLPSSNAAGLAGAHVVCVDDFMALIARDVMAEGMAARAAISEQYPLLRHTQLLLCGYRKKPNVMDNIPHVARVATLPKVVGTIADK